MINELYIEKLVNLIKQGIVTIDDIKIQEYKEAVRARLTNAPQGPSV